MFDKDGGGTISKDEIKQILAYGQDVSNETVDAIIKQIDENGDGEISFQEFQEMMKS
jgi:Ca2+-binding EF-hand superfamily protein